MGSSLSLMIIAGINERIYLSCEQGLFPSKSKNIIEAFLGN
jgi:hypothetical protein